MAQLNDPLKKVGASVIPIFRAIVSCHQAAAARVRDPVCIDLATGGIETVLDLRQHYGENWDICPLYSLSRQGY